MSEQPKDKLTEREICRLKKISYPSLAITINNLPHIHILMPDFPVLSLKKYSLCRELRFEMPFKLNLGIWIVQIYLTLYISQNNFFQPWAPSVKFCHILTVRQGCRGNAIGPFLGTQSSLHFSCSRNIFSLCYVRLIVEFCINTSLQDLKSFIAHCRSYSFAGVCHQITWNKKKGQLYSESYWLFSCS